MISVKNEINFNNSVLTKELNQLNIEQAKNLAGEIFGHLFWTKRVNRLHRAYETKQYLASMKKLRVRLLKGIDNHRFSPKKTKCGNNIEHERVMGTGMFYRLYVKPTDLDLGGDAYYFGYANREDRRINTYCENDVDIITCQDIESFEREVAYYRDYFMEMNA